MCKISVITPVYKVENYLRKCIDSILNQTFTDYELFIVDDGSPDSSPAICDEFAKSADTERYAGDWRRLMTTSTKAARTVG